MRRSKWKGNYVSKSILRLKDTSKNFILIRSRSSVIPEYLVGKRVFIFCGSVYKSLDVDFSCVGYKFGAFASTRTFVKKPADDNLTRKKKNTKRKKNQLKVTLEAEFLGNVKKD